MSRFTKTPTPPYYAVIFSNTLNVDDAGYGEMAEKMFDMALTQDGCFGAESTRDEARFGITVSYWRDEASIAKWKAEVSHLAAQHKGMTKWYDHYHLRVAKVERAYEGPEGRAL
jgi:heme-degrading monooxygenase HmoA